MRTINSTGEGPIRLASDIAKQHGISADLRDASSAWKELMGYAQDLEHRELALRNQLESVTRERDLFQQEAARLQAAFAEARDDLHDLKVRMGI